MLREKIVIVTSICSVLRGQIILSHSNRDCDKGPLWFQCDKNIWLLLTMSFRKVAPSRGKPYQDSSACKLTSKWFQLISNNFICFLYDFLWFSAYDFIGSDLLIFYAILFGPISRYQPMVNSESDSIRRSFLKSFHKKKGPKVSQSWVMGKGWKLFSGWPLGRKWIPIELPAELPRLASESVEHLNQADQHRRTPLHMAAFFGKADAVWNARRWNCGELV